MEKKLSNVIVVGASAGGFESVSRFLSGISVETDAAIFVVIHLPQQASMEVITRQMQKSSPFPCIVPSDGDEISNKTVYIAPPDKHMMVIQNQVLIKSGAKENHWRPAIDTLFRSAAAAFDSCVFGVILTGLLDDGTSGMMAVKKSGGICIVQHPDEATFPDMPLSVINNIEVDYSVSVLEMGYIINDIMHRRPCQPKAVPKDVKKEADITLRMNSSYNEVKDLGKPTAVTCPDCGGVLTQIDEENNVRFRCFTGHAFTFEQLNISQKDALENSIWVAIRMLEERRNLLFSLSRKQIDKNTVSKDQEERATDINTHIERLKAFLMDIPKL